MTSTTSSPPAIAVAYPVHTSENKVIYAARHVEREDPFDAFKQLKTSHQGGKLIERPTEVKIVFEKDSKSNSVEKKSTKKSKTRNQDASTRQKSCKREEGSTRQKSCQEYSEKKEKVQLMYSSTVPKPNFKKMKNRRRSMQASAATVGGVTGALVAGPVGALLGGVVAFGVTKGVMKRRDRRVRRKYIKKVMEEQEQRMTEAHEATSSPPLVHAMVL